MESLSEMQSLLDLCQTNMARFQKKKSNAWLFQQSMCRFMIPKEDIPDEKFCSISRDFLRVKMVKQCKASEIILCQWLDW